MPALRFQILLVTSNLANQVQLDSYPTFSLGTHKLVVGPDQLKSGLCLLKSHARGPVTCHASYQEKLSPFVEMDSVHVLR